MTSGKAFATVDRLLDEARGGPMYLRQPEIADMIVEVLFSHRKGFAALQHHCVCSDAKPCSFVDHSESSALGNHENGEKLHGKESQFNAGAHWE
jgi:hypothetical protein